MRRLALAAMLVAVPFLVLAGTCLAVDRKVVIEYFSNTG